MHNYASICVIMQHLRGTCAAPGRNLRGTSRNAPTKNAENRQRIQNQCIICCMPIVYSKYKIQKDVRNRPAPPLTPRFQCWGPRPRRRPGARARRMDLDPPTLKSGGRGGRRRGVKCRSRFQNHQTLFFFTYI